MNKKVIFFLLFVISISCVFWWEKPHYFTAVSGEKLKKDVIGVFFPFAEGSRNSNEILGATPEKKSALESENKLFFSPLEITEQQLWLESRGNFLGVGTSEYDNYDFSTLQQLVGSGDLHAMHKLAQLYISGPYLGEYGYRAAEDMLMRAAIYGSSSALAEIADFKYTQRLVAESELDKRHLVIVSLSYYRAAELRGDYWGSLNVRDPLLTKEPIMLQLEEKESIESLAQAIYTQLEAQREKMGLGAFDNSVPESVLGLFESYKNQ